MHICVFSERMALPLDEGIKNYAFRLGQELDEQHTLLRLTTFGEDVPAWGIRNVPGNPLLLSPDLARQVHRFQPDLIIYVPTACATPFSFARSRVLKLYGRGAPVVLVALQVRSYGRLARALMPHLKPDLVLVQAERTHISLEACGCRLRTVPPGIDMQRFRPVSAQQRVALRQRYGVSPQVYVVLHVGHLNRGRNVQILRDLQRQPGQQVVIVGSTSTPQDAALVTELEQEGAKIIAEYLPNIAEVYQMADCYVFPVEARTSAIDLPLSVLEAMACDLPVVTTRFGGLPALFQPAPGLCFVQDLGQLIGAVEACKQVVHPDTRQMVAPFAWPRVAAGLLGTICAELNLETRTRGRSAPA